MNATSYTWTLPAGATITTGAGTTSITVNFAAAAIAGNISVAGTNGCGEGTSSSIPVTVHAIPAAPVVTAAGSILRVVHYLETNVTTMASSFRVQPDKPIP